MIWDSNGQVMGFLRLLIFIYLFIFSDIRLSIDRVPIERNRLQLISFHPEHEFFVLGFNVDHSKLKRLSFCPVCYGLPTLQT